MTYELGLERGRRKMTEPVGAQALGLEEAAGAMRGVSPLQSRHCRRLPTDVGWTLSLLGQASCEGSQHMGCILTSLSEVFPPLEFSPAWPLHFHKGL